MNLREMRGMELAETRTIRKRDGWWWVPSQSGSRMYRVQLAQKFATCECPDFEKRGQACKHIVAACVMQIKQECHADGTTTVTQRLMFATEKKTTYPQAWSAYNEAQTSERDRFMELLAELCSGLPTLQPKTGRPRLPLSDVVFNVTFKVYSTFSQRRFMSDLREAHVRGHISTKRSVRFSVITSSFLFTRCANLESILFSGLLLNILWYNSRLPSITPEGDRFHG